MHNFISEDKLQNKFEKIEPAPVDSLTIYKLASERGILEGSTKSSVEFCQTMPSSSIAAFSCSPSDLHSSH